MVRILVDTGACQQYGQCCYAAGDVFEIDDDGQLVYQAEADESRRADIERAADACPMQAITVE